MPLMLLIIFICLFLMSFMLFTIFVSLKDLYIKENGTTDPLATCLLLTNIYLSDTVVTFG